MRTCIEIVKKMRNMTNLKENIWIEGYNTYEDITISWDPHKWSDLIYHGKTSEIPEKILETAMPDPDNTWNEKLCQCGERTTCYYCAMHFDLKEEINEYCDKEYCIIYKK
jgi:hypothetical protein